MKNNFRNIFLECDCKSTDLHNIFKDIIQLCVSLNSIWKRLKIVTSLPLTLSAFHAIWIFFCICNKITHVCLHFLLFKNWTLLFNDCWSSNYMFQTHHTVYMTQVHINKCLSSQDILILNYLLQIFNFWATFTLKKYVTSN